MLQSVLQKDQGNKIMKTGIIILTGLTFLLANGLSSAERKQENTLQETISIDDILTTNFKFALKTLLQTLQLINAEKPTHSSIQLLDTVCHYIEYLVVESVRTASINPPSFPYKDEFIINNWENVKKQWKKIKNSDYYHSSDLKKLFERHDCNMNGFFEVWER